MAFDAICHVARSNTTSSNMHKQNEKMVSSTTSNRTLQFTAEFDQVHNIIFHSTRLEVFAQIKIHIMNFLVV
jgi:hypothetical protein